LLTHALPLPQALIRDKRWRNLALLAISKNRRVCAAPALGAIPCADTR
jgi:septum formation inhibitor-activating ATPase MinD